MSKPITIKNKKQLIEGGIIKNDGTMYGYSPLFDPITELKIDVHNNFSINTLGVKYIENEDVTKRISIQVLKKAVDLKNKHKNIKEVSKWLYDNISTTVVDINNMTGDLSCLDRLILVHIHRESNHIAACTRRGAGNIILVGKKISNNIKNLLKKDIDNTSYVDYAKDYKFIGTINNSIVVYEDNTNLLKNNEALLTYNNIGSSLDKGIFISESKPDNCYYITSNDGLSENSYSDYYKKIQFKNLP